MAIKIAFDIKEMKVGCVLLQGGMGGDSSVVSQRFDTKYWLLAPTPDLHLYEVTEDQLDQLVRKVEEHWETPHE